MSEGLLRFGIIGFGLMGQNRAKALAEIPGTRLVAVYDPNADRRAEAAAKFGCEAEADHRAVLDRSDVDAVIIAVPHFLAREIVLDALERGKHVLCEKPLGLDVAECDEIISKLRPEIRLAAGFNYRFYPGIQRARQLLREGVAGELTHLRFELGHGGRPGYESEWKTKKATCGGGALLDPGIHVIDLVRFLAGEVEGGDASLLRSFWPIDVEDNAFATLRLANGRLAHIHISITEWKSRFALDLFGTDAMIQVTGRSGFYGPQRVVVSRRWDWLQDPAGAIAPQEFPLEDISFREELAQFAGWLRGGSSGDLGVAEDGRKALDLVSGLYAKGSWMRARETALSGAGR